MITFTLTKADILMILLLLLCLYAIRDLSFLKYSSTSLYLRTDEILLEQRETSQHMAKLLNDNTCENAAVATAPDSALTLQHTNDQLRDRLSIASATALALQYSNEQLREELNWLRGQCFEGRYGPYL